MGPLGPRGGIALGMCLIALALSFESIRMILLAALGLGAVIFVHELGHFAVAKMCGVKCEKFFIGFDIGGYKISRQWGETEYGIGILPLGGYVKMLGQDDNPAHISDQLRESQVNDAAGVRTKEIVGPDGESYVVDERSYLAKSVPQRMAIISAGVIMNVIFAFVFAVVAYGLGVKYMPCVVSETVPGSPAWKANIRTGDQIVQIGNRRKPSFTQLKGAVTLADLESGVEFQIASPGQTERPVTLRPEKGKGLATIGIFPPLSLRLIEEKPVLDDSPAAQTGKFEGGDEIIRVGDEYVSSYHEFVAQLTRNVSEPLTITVRRNASADGTTTEEVTGVVAPNPMKRLGLVMNIGKIVAVQDESPAAEAGLRPGDFIEQINGQPVGQSADGQRRWDPISLPQRFQAMAIAGEEAVLLVRRSQSGSDGGQGQEEITVMPRVATWLDSFGTPGAPVSVPSLGIAYRVIHIVDMVLPGSPAEAAGLRANDQILSAEFELPAEAEDDFTLSPLTFSDEKHRWPALIRQLQWLPAGTKLTLHFARGGTIQSTTIDSTFHAGDYYPKRGFVLHPEQRLRQAASFREQLQLGANETRDALSMVYRFLRKLFEQQVPLTALGGPITIAQVAGYSALEGVSKLLIFLTILSANLAVVNFLPIPLLDGGHMLFLIYEGIYRRPAPERLVIAAHTIGFLFIVSLMAFVIGLDIGLINRDL